MSIAPAVTAREFAVIRHGDQMYGDHPYVFHLDQVADLARRFGPDAEDMAYLHDVGEDTDTTMNEIESLFGALTASGVDLLSDPPGASRKERKAKAYVRLSSVSGKLVVALIVKACDRLCNVRACVEGQNLKLLTMYRGEHAAFRAAAYRHGACDELWVELDTLLSDEMFDKISRPPEAYRG